MTAADLAAAAADLLAEADLTPDPARRGPVPLARLFKFRALQHDALPALTCRVVRRHLLDLGVPVVGLGDEDERLAGFVFAAGPVGFAFVNADDPLPRRRFTAAHELGHFVLHRGTMGGFRADTPDALPEADDDAADQMEREANRFAAELLMPVAVCAARADELKAEHGACPRGVLEYRLAAELLVSREAIRYRLAGLGVGDD